MELIEITMIIEKKLNKLIDRRKIMIVFIRVI